MLTETTALPLNAEPTFDLARWGSALVECAGDLDLSTSADRETFTVRVAKALTHARYDVLAALLDLLGAEPVVNRYAAIDAIAVAYLVLALPNA